MSMTLVDVDKLVEWLGREGAIAGLEASDLTVSELLEIAELMRVPIDRKSRRRSIAIEIVNSGVRRIDKSRDELLRMDPIELRDYFKAKNVSRTELLSLLNEFGIHAGSEAKKSLLDFTAREIGDMGMYQRVAKGKQGR
jgi:hypothetical protein